MEERYRELKQIIEQRYRELNQAIVRIEIEHGEKLDALFDAFKINNENITIKLPMTIDGIKVCKKLSSEGIKTNVTLIFSVPQAILAMEAGATFISPFMGRMDDRYDSHDAGYNLIEEIDEVRRIYGYKSKIIAASIRNVEHVKEAALAGADIATIPFKVIKQMYEHPLTTSGLATFKKDAEGK